MNGGYERRGPTWGDHVRGGLSAIILEGLIVFVLVVFALVVAFLAVTVV
jgi:hypothetical protein